MRPIRRRRLCLLLAGLLALLCGCASTATASEVDEAVRQELGQAFGGELRSLILPNRDLESAMLDLGYCVSVDGYVRELDTLRAFARDTEAGADCSLTVIHYSASFVVTRVQFYGGAGYYYRYEYNRFDPDKIEISSRPVQGVELVEMEQPVKCELTLLHGDGDSQLTFRLEEKADAEETD